VIAGPRMYDPARNKPYTQHSWVTVTQVNNLVNQVVEVTWRGFTPSSSVVYAATSTDYPVMVAECKGTHPTKWSQCFGADNGGTAGSFSPYGPMNTSYTTTSSNGTGVAFIQMLTGVENQLLGCDKGTPCSLVIVPSQGGNIFDSPPNCADHSQDAGGTDIGAIAFNASYGACSWKKRIIVPMNFAPTPTDCPVHNPNFSAIGSPMLERAMSSWQSALCSVSSPVNIQYDSAQNEPLARQDFLSGTDDVGLTTVPGASKGATHPFTYAPVAISAESVAFWIDNPRDGKPLTHLKLDARLVAKLLTQSYDFEFESCGKGMVPKGVVGCDNAVDNNPSSLFADPEFMKLNPHIASVGDGFQIPTVLSGLSDMTWELTRWIAANHAAKSFVDGAFDPWGMHVNTDYLNMQLPTQSLSSMDPYLPIAHRYDPVYPLSSVAQYQVFNWYPATDWQPDSQGNYDKLTPEEPGDRALFAILDQADAFAYKLPVAALENAAGKYVLPTDAGMTAALGTMHTDSNHITQDVQEHDKKATGAYPLTMVIYAMVPTGGIAKKKAKKIAQWLDFVANQGQVQGDLPGDLPPGYLPLTAKMRAQTLKAAREVLSQKGNAQAAPSATPTATPKPSPSQGHISLGFVSNPLTAGLLRYALPILLIAGAMLAVGGSFALAIGRGGAVAVTRLRRFRMPRVRPPRMKLPNVKLPRRNKP
jgi:PBP superfamily domain